ncbi:hypothetical protein CGLAUT_06960 [Corynebacterium glaucum]|nr:hypothetical protein CGLAUT_06960 [Corynebacterium glaucum]
MTAPSALAHDAVISGSPANGEVVEEFPSKLSLEFSGQPQEGFSTLALSRISDGQPEVLYSGEPQLDGQWVSLDVPSGLDTQPGDYRIGFQIVSSDGHATKGMTTFTYAPAGSEVSPVASETSGESGESTMQPENLDDETRSNMNLILAVLGVVVVAGAAFAALARRKKSEDLEGDMGEEE